MSASHVREVADAMGRDLRHALRALGTLGDRSSSGRMAGQAHRLANARLRWMFMLPDSGMHGAASAASVQSLITSSFQGARPHIQASLTLTSFRQPRFASAAEQWIEVFKRSADRAGRSSIGPWLALHHHHQAVSPGLGPCVSDAESWLIAGKLPEYNFRPVSILRRCEDLSRPQCSSSSGRRHLAHATSDIRAILATEMLIGEPICIW